MVETRLIGGLLNTARRAVVVVIGLGLLLSVAVTAADADTSVRRDPRGDSYGRPETDIRSVRLSNGARSIRADVRLARVDRTGVATALTIDPGPAGGPGFFARGSRSEGESRWHTDLYRVMNQSTSAPGTRVPCPGLRIRDFRRSDSLRIVVPQPCLDLRARSSRFQVFVFEPLEGLYRDQLDGGRFRVRRG